MSLRIVFMGTPDFAVPTLIECIGQGHQIVACYTQPPRRSGRGMAQTRSPVHVQADAFGIPVRTPETLKTERATAEFEDHAADVAVVIAYGRILPRAILDAPAHGCLNLHASLLPRWRGAAPIQRAIMAGDAETGVAVMRMEEGLDTGPVCMVEKVRIGENETAGELHDRLSRLGADLMARGLAALSRDSLTCAEQPKHGVTYAAKIDKVEAEIDWTRPAREAHNHIRGLSPFPGAWFQCRLNDKSERIKVLRSVPVEGHHGARPGTLLDKGLTVACADGALRLTDVQRAGKAAMPAADFLRGTSLQPGEHLGG